jgi:CheY-like chemotaxis protein
VIKKILLIEDELEILTILKTRLEQEGYAVWATSSGREAVELASNFLPDLILTDIVLPDIDGPEAIKSISNDPQLSAVLVIFFSGILGGDESSGKLPEVFVGGRRYPAIAKPFSFRQLMEKINECQ